MIESSRSLESPLESTNSKDLTLSGIASSKTLAKPALSSLTITAPLIRPSNLSSRAELTLTSAPSVILKVTLSSNSESSSNRS